MNEPSELGVALSHQIANYLVHALVIEYHRHTTGSNINRNSVSHDERSGMINLEPIAIDQGHSEWPKGNAFHQRQDRLVKVLDPHFSPIPHNVSGPRDS